MNSPTTSLRIPWALRVFDGSTLFRYNDQSVALFPYVAGAPFDHENPKLRQEAATFLARLHATLLNRAPVSAGLQRHLLIGAPPLPPAPDPDSLIDLELDIWHTTVLQKSASFSTGLIHSLYPVAIASGIAPSFRTGGSWSAWRT